MNFRKTKLYKTIMTGSSEMVMKTLWEYLKAGKDVNIKDEQTGGTLLHLLVENGERFSSPETVQAVYMLVCKDVDIDAQDVSGETGLHKVMRKKGSYRIMMALVRCGSDTAVTNNDGKTAEELLLTEKPDGWEEMQHWYNKFKPGLWRALSAPDPDRKLVERLLRNWCRLTCVKNGKVTSIKSLVKDDIHKLDLLQMIEQYENANEMALALNAGFGFIVKSWVQQDIELLKHVDPNTRDYSYQHSYPEYPEVPRPLLAAAWESNNYDAVDVLMDMNPNTRMLYTNEAETVNPPKPIFFQLICGNSIPRDERIKLRVFKGADLSARDSEGHTILHKCVIHDQPESTVKLLMQYGADIAARDRLGRTAREVADRLQKQQYSRCIDEHIVKLVKDKKFDEIEKLILHNYDHLLDISDNAKRTMVEIAKKYGTRQIYEVVKLTAAIQAYIRRVYAAIDDGNIEDVRKLLSCKKYSNVRDKCGRTLLHKALLQRKKEIVLFLLEECPHIFNIGDCLDRMPLHYAQLFMPEDAVMNVLITQGANKDLTDTRGRKANDYKLENCGSQTYKALQKEVSDLDLNIYLSENDFDQSFDAAIKKGDIETVKSLVLGLRGFGDVSRYSNKLFDCVDNKQIEIAKFLILNGFKVDIYKQYNKCDPSDPMCAMMECGHSMSSLKDRAMDQKCDEILELVEAASSGKLRVLPPEGQNGISSYGV